MNRPLLCFSGPFRALLLGLATLLFSFAVLHKTPVEQVQDYYTLHLRRFHDQLTRFQDVAYSADTTALRRQFAACRTEYKQLEFAVEYYYPHAAQRLNGANLPETEAGEPDEVIPPSGFQVLEEYVYAAPPTTGPTATWCTRKSTTCSIRCATSSSRRPC
ncbi:hypothetical protein [Hymenobacter cellulosilyticus]|uniref:Uncharacterized protein n=1 Tax=Hymenobacter cellulosilyticus TaxID=2932248 RepID=A0A8T9Q9Y5_9BACT|nr:hypothetical protein [Hymenobacter cellulosilyticus]UOQ71743.1 hypothetical protein MUN79_24585 [Hymenobacter cellulosilyticus]